MHKNYSTTILALNIIVDVDIAKCGKRDHLR
jgi:hypothetical protein